MLEGALVVAPPGIHVSEPESDLYGDPSPGVSPPLSCPLTFGHWCHAMRSESPPAAALLNARAGTMWDRVANPCKRRLLERAAQHHGHPRAVGSPALAQLGEVGSRPVEAVRRPLQARLGGGQPVGLVGSPHDDDLRGERADARDRLQL